MVRDYYPGTTPTSCFLQYPTLLRPIVKGRPPQTSWDYHPTSLKWPGGLHEFSVRYLTANPMLAAMVILGTSFRGEACR